MPENIPHLTIGLDAGPGSDDESRAEFARRLRKELLTLNEVERAEPAAAPAPPGSKSAGIDWQTIIVTALASGGALTTLIGLVQKFITRREGASVTLEVNGDKLTITGASSETERRLTDSWVARHGA